MGKSEKLMTYVTVFALSFITISLELFLTRILNLKAWNHVVYIVIPFAILGYGIGANIYLLLKEKLKMVPQVSILRSLCLSIATTILLSTYAIIYLPIRVDYLLNIFTSLRAILMLGSAYSIFMIPFIFIGFLVVYIFSRNPKDVHKLYFLDLAGAGIAAAAFFLLIDNFAVVRSLWIMSFIMIFLAIFSLPFGRKKIIMPIIAVILCALTFFIIEPIDYTVDEKKGWEWIPGYFPKETYEHVLSQWHPLGRTDIFRMTDKKTREDLAQHPGTFQINVKPRPEFAYFSSNFLAGTPVYNLSKDGLAKENSRVQLFSKSMEVPYLLLDHPRVVVIGVGGGRDIFMANTHGASEIVGAEINPGIVRAMRPGGTMHEYSGGVYTLDNTVIHLIDGRHLVKSRKPDSTDLIILNGVDTFSGLSSGAYAYAESYLYTKNAIKDYLAILSDDGMINFNRWLFQDQPRESLKLYAIILEALKELGAKDPEQHVIIGGDKGWSLMLIKKTPFLPYEVKKVQTYFENHDVIPIYPVNDVLQKKKGPLLSFHAYTDFFLADNIHEFEKTYPFDISIITDDNPFFYKYYKLSSFNPFKTHARHHTGPVIFLTQTVVFVQALVMILLFIFIPLLTFKKNDIQNLPRKTLIPFILYFSCLGTGFMFIEIPMMQQFVLLLGSPIYAITVILSALLISAGTGSMSLESLQKKCTTKYALLTFSTLILAFYLITLNIFGTHIYNHIILCSFIIRILFVAATIFPVGFILGLFFPSGLQVISQNYEDTIAWAWGINGGFSVLGSILAIIIAQFFGFKAILLLGLLCYFVAIKSFKKLEHLLS